MSDARWRAAAGREAAQLAERGHHVGRRLVEREAVVLGHVAEAGAHADRVAGDVLPAHLDRALRRVGQAEQQAEHRRLAGPVGADQPDAPARHLERQAVERGHAGVALGEAVEAEEGFHGLPIMPVTRPFTYRARLSLRPTEASPMSDFIDKDRADDAIDQVQGTKD